MSWQATTAVLRHSKAKGSERLLMLCIANYAGEDGAGAFPSNATLCEDSKLTERAVRYIMRKLEGSGELGVEKSAGPNGTNKYTILLPFADGRRKKTPVLSTVSTASTVGQSLPGQSAAPRGAKCSPLQGQGVAPKQSAIEEQSKNLTKPSGSGEPAIVDARHHPVRERIKQLEAEHLTIPLAQVPWKARSAAALAKWLAATPGLELDLILALVDCHYASPARLGLEFHEWIPELWKYKGGPINQYGTRLAEDREYQRDQRIRAEAAVGTRRQ